jgi:TP901 family phage tail tape measure protein
MANRTVAVNFIANTAPYTAGVTRASKATAGLTTAATAAIAKFIGPAALVYGLSQASKASLQFEDEMTKLRTQIGLTNPEIDRMRSAALGLGGATTKGPQELAEATFFIASAGLRGAAAMDVLRSSAQLSAIGLGDTATIADLLTSAVNAYGEESLSAASASDSLVAAVRLGKLEADQLAGAMGRVLPIASAMGVTFEEVGGFMAAMSRTGTDAATAATQLRAIMVSLLKPAQQSRDAMHDYGVTAEGLREIIEEDGLFAALMHLNDATDGNAEAFAEIFPNVRALAGVMDLLGPQLEGNAELMAEMGMSTGVAAEAFEAFSVTTRAEMNRTSAEISRAMIVIGDRTEGVVFQISRAVRMSVQAIGDAAERAEDASGFTERVGLDLVSALRSIQEETRGLSRADREAAMAQDGMSRALLDARDAYSRLTLAQQADAFTKEVRMGLLKGLIGVEEELTEAFIAQALSLVVAQDGQRGLNADAERYTRLAERMLGPTEDAKSAFDELAESLGMTTEEMDAATRAIDENRRAQLAVIDPVYGAVRAQRDYMDALAELTRVQGDAEASADDLVDAVFDVMIAEIERQAAMDAAGLVTDGFISTLNETAKALGIEEKALERVLGRLADLGISLDILDGRVVSPTIDVRLNLPDLPSGLDWGAGGLPAVPGGGAAPAPAPAPGAPRRSGPSAPAPDPFAGIPEHLRPVGMRAAGGPVRAGAMYLVGEQGPELFAPAVAGSIIPNGTSAQMMGGTGGITIQSYNTYRSADDQALLSMLEMAQQAGRL